MNFDGFEMQHRVARDAEPQIARVLRRKARLPDVEHRFALRNFGERLVVVAHLDHERDCAVLPVVTPVFDRERRERDRRAEVVFEPRVFLERGVEQDIRFDFTALVLSGWHSAALELTCHGTPLAKSRFSGHSAITAATGTSRTKPTRSTRFTLAHS